MRHQTDIGPKYSNRKVTPKYVYASKTGSQKFSEIQCVHFMNIAESKNKRQIDENNYEQSYNTALSLFYNIILWLTIMLISIKWLKFMHV